MDGGLVACGFAHLEVCEFKDPNPQCKFDLLLGRRGILGGLDLPFSPGLVAVLGAMIAVINECSKKSFIESTNLK